MLAVWLLCVSPALGQRDEPTVRAEVEARQAELDAAVASGELELRTAPPAEGTVPLPARLAALVTARARYLAASDAEPSTRWRYELANADVMYRYGQVRWALEAYWRVYRESCRIDGDVVEEARNGVLITASRTRNLWLLDRVVDGVGACLQSERALEACARWRAEEERCGEPPPPGVCGAISRPVYSFGHGVELYQRGEAERSDGRPHIAIYEHAAAELVGVIEGELRHSPDCWTEALPRALLVAGSALSYAGRPRAAADLFERAVAVDHELDAASRYQPSELDHVLAVALFSAGIAARDAGDYDLALTHWARLREDVRLAASTDPDMPAIRLDAMVESARLLMWLDRHEAAASLLDRIVRDHPDAEETPLAALLALEERVAAPDFDRPALAEATRVFLERRELPIELTIRALDVLVVVTRGRERRDAETRLRAMALELPAPGDDESVGPHHRIAARIEEELARHTRGRAEAARLLERARARRVDRPETCALGRVVAEAACRHVALPNALLDPVE